MDVEIHIEKWEDLKLATKLLGDYGSECKTWTVKGTVWTKQED